MGEIFLINRCCGMMNCNEQIEKKLVFNTWWKTHLYTDFDQQLVVKSVTAAKYQYWNVFDQIEDLGGEIRNLPCHTNQKY